MKINQAVFEKSAPTILHAPEGNLPEIAFVGRSNVGKSSLINYLINRKKLARTSSAPGRTQTLNYYLLNDKFYFVDFPGYGYAKASKGMRNQWEKAREEYLLNRENLKGVVHVVDIRHDASPLDVDMLNFLRGLDMPFFVVLTKADKISKSKQRQHAQKIANDLSMGIDQLYVISSEKKYGKDSLLKELANLVI
jgi:GTP-binding protein